nr:hypothetical protein [Rhizobium lentis]
MTGLLCGRADLLPVGYFHVIFILPQEIAAITFQNKAALYAMLFRAVAETLRKLAADPRNLGADIGFHRGVALLGTDAPLSPAYPLHRAGGGLSFDQSRSVACRANFFLAELRVYTNAEKRRLLRSSAKRACCPHHRRFLGDVERPPATCRASSAAREGLQT